MTAKSHFVTLDSGGGLVPLLHPDEEEDSDKGT
jgi:hypothetical protein